MNSLTLILGLALTQTSTAVGSVPPMDAPDPSEPGGPALGAADTVASATVAEALPAPVVPVARAPALSGTSVGIDFAELIDPGAAGGGVLVLHLLTTRLSLDFFSDRLGLVLEVPLALATPFDTGAGAKLLLGDPSAMFSVRFAGGVLRASVGAGIGIPLMSQGQIQDGAAVHALDGALSADGGASGPHWTNAFAFLIAAELGLDLEPVQVSLRLATAIPVEEIKPGGDLSLQASYAVSPLVSLGGRVGLARYELPKPELRVVRVCIADSPDQCPAFPSSFVERFEIDEPVLRLSPFVSLNLGPELRFSWTLLLASLGSVEGVYLRHELGAALSVPF